MHELKTEQVTLPAERSTQILHRGEYVRGLPAGYAVKFVGKRSGEGQRVEVEVVTPREFTSDRSEAERSN